MKRYYLLSFLSFIILSVLFRSSYLNNLQDTHESYVSNSRYIQGDSIQYSIWAQRELDFSPFMTSIAKIEVSNVSLVFFSFLQRLIEITEVSAFSINIAVMSVAALGIFFLSSAVASKRRYSVLAIPLCLSNITYMQTLTKEVLCFALLPWIIFFFLRRKYFFLLFAIILLSFIRIYFAGFLCIAMGIYVLPSRWRPYCYIAYFGSLTIFYVYVFKQFMLISTFISSYSFSSLYKTLLPTPFIPILFMPVRFCLNIAEPAIEIARGWGRINIIYNIPTYLDFFTSLVISLMTSLVVYKLYKSKKVGAAVSPQARLSLTICFVSFLGISFSPIVHFRYLTAFLPLLALTLDYLRFPKST